MANNPMNYGFVRDFAALGSDEDDIVKLVNAGYAGALFNWADPGLAKANATKLVGLTVPPKNSKESSKEYETCTWLISVPEPTPPQVSPLISLFNW